MSPAVEITSRDGIPATLSYPGARQFWLAVLLTGIGTGLGAAALTRLLEATQHLAWQGSATNILEAAQHASVARHIYVLLAAGLITGAGQLILRQLSSGNGIDTTAAIWLYAGRMPAVRTLGSALLSIFVVGLGASLGREGAPKQAGALFALEVMRGKLALRYVLPALFCSIIATAVAWLALPDAPTYIIPAYSSFASVLVWSLQAAPVAAVASVFYVRLISWADRNRPRGWRRLTAPVIGLGLVGVVSIWFPQILGNGRDLSQLLFYLRRNSDDGVNRPRPLLHPPPTGNRRNHHPSRSLYRTAFHLRCTANRRAVRATPEAA